jgi:hypothetical protein
MRLSSHRYLPLVVILGFLVPTAVHAQQDVNIMEGSPYIPVFEIMPNGKGDMVAVKFRLDQAYDTNLVGTQTEQFAGTYSSLESDISYIHQHPGSMFMLTYRGGGNLYPQSQYSGLNAPLNAVRFQLRQNLTKRLSMGAAGDWGSLPGGAFEQVVQPPVLGGGDQNATFLAERSVSADGTLSFQYQLTPHTYVTWGANYNRIRYEPSTLAPSQAENAFGAYYYKFSQAQTISFGFANQWIDFPGTGVNSQVHNFLITYANKLTSTLTLNGYVGPAFVNQIAQSGGSSTSITTSQTQMANVVGGASLSWDPGHTDIVLRYDRMYANGSNLVGTSLRQIAGLTFSRFLSRHLVAALDLNYTTNDVVSFPAQNNTSYRIQPTIRYHLKSRLWLTASEGYVRAVGLFSTGAQDRSVTLAGIDFNLPNFVLEK